MKVSIIIPNWNGREKLEKNLPAVLAVEGVEEVIVVDDASTDDSVKFLKENYVDKVKIIEKRKNTGFGSNVNLGVEKSRGDLIFLVNSDAVPEKKCIKQVIHHFDNPRVFSVGFNTGGNWSWAKFEKGFFWHYMVQKNNKPHTHETLWASGGSAVFRRKIWDDLGGFDPLYDPFYVEDLDLGYRARKRGFINMWDADAKVEHYKQKGVIEENYSKKTISNTTGRNQLLFVWKNITSPILIRQHILGLVMHILLHPKYFLIFFMAFTRLLRIVQERRVEARSQVLTDEEVLAKYSAY